MVSNNRKDRDRQAYIENPIDQGTDRRVHDLSLNDKLKGSGGLLAGVEYDSVSVAYPTSTTEVYTFYTGGLAGTLQATITLTYTNASKANLSSAVKT